MNFESHPHYQTLRRWLTQPKGIIHQVLAEFLMFGFKQAWACLFGGLLLALILGTALYYPEDAPIARYDFLFVGAIVIQVFLLVFKLETPAEMKVIILFHLIGTGMELFKTHMGSWAYPEANLIRLGEVPLFSGFMYSAVGSYIARVWRGFDFRFTRHPPIWTVSLLSVAVYINFFSHHYFYDLRYALFAVTALLFVRTRVYFRVLDQHRWMPLLLGFVLVAFFIWLAENMSTFAHIWLYPSQQDGWKFISIAKMGSWFLLMIISYGLIARLHEIKEPPPQSANNTIQ